MKKTNNIRSKEVTKGRGTSIVRKLIDDYITRNSGGQSLITVTSIQQADRSNNVLVRVSVLPETQENAVIDFLERNASDMRNYIKENSRLGMLPFLSFEIDRGEKHRQSIFEII
jgi:ribosome-binding factor A